MTRNDSRGSAFISRSSPPVVSSRSVYATLPFPSTAPDLRPGRRSETLHHAAEFSHGPKTIVTVVVPGGAGSNFEGTFGWFSAACTGLSS